VVLDGQSAGWVVGRATRLLLTTGLLHSHQVEPVA
jgi:hypothetical protein